ncbi:putative hydrolase, alpha/beta fold LipV [Deltaproteobacteria bacterium]|nr:putative hydrolase, alpha/beta fold LipV [Deltaproteobacteria bacterium]
MTAAPRLILLPGLDGTGRLFDAFIPELGDHPTQIVAYPADRVLRVDALADLVQAALPESGPIVLVGESFSGRVALEVAAREPSRTLGVVLVASFIRNPTFVPPLFAAMLPDFAFAVTPPRWLFRALLAGEDAPEALVDELQRSIASVTPPVLAARVREVLNHTATARPEFAQLPALYLRGTQDRLVGKAAVAGVAAMLPQLQVVEIDAPHLVLQRGPVEAARVIAEFVDGISRGIIGDLRG